MNHEELVTLAERWLIKQRCSVVCTRLVSSSPETPDAIGWNGSLSTLVEVKVSRSDFAADRQKMSRRIPQYSMGIHRYFLVPSGLIKASELPTKWGLLELTGNTIRKTVDAGVCRTNRRNELLCLLSIIRRGIKCAGVSCRFYTIENINALATCGAVEYE